MWTLISIFHLIPTQAFLQAIFQYFLYSHLNFKHAILQICELRIIRHFKRARYNPAVDGCTGLRSLDCSVRGLSYFAGLHGSRALYQYRNASNRHVGFVFQNVFIYFIIFIESWVCFDDRLVNVIYFAMKNSFSYEFQFSFLDNILLYAQGLLT